MRVGLHCAFVAILIAGGPLVATQAPTFSTRVDAVRVDVLATRDGRPIDGLQARDFEVRDNGIVQKVDLVSFEQLPVNVMFALDVSNSVSGEGLQHLRSAGRTVLAALKAGDRAGLVSFSHAISVREPLTTDVSRVDRAFAALAASGRTALFDATYVALTVGEPDGTGRSLVLLFSDGDDTISWLTPGRVIESARRSNVTVYAAGVRGAEPDFLRAVTAATGGGVIEIDSTQDVTSTFVRIFDEFRRRYIVSYSPTGVARGGWHRIQVRVKNRPAEVRSRQTYYDGP